MFTKEEEKEERAYIPPDYSETEKLCPVDDEDDDDDLDMDDDDDFDEEEEDEDPAEEDSRLENATPKTNTSALPFSHQPTFSQPTPNFSKNMSTPNWPGVGGGGFGGYGAASQPTQPSWGSTATPFSPRPTSGGWGSSPTTTTGWGSGTTQKETLDRSKKIVFCDVLDCLVITPEAGQRLGLIPRGIYDIQLRLDVWAALRRLCPLERIYAMIPRSLILSGAGEDSWMVMLNYVACALAEFLKIPSSACQILTQNYIVQPKAEIIGSVLGNIDRSEAVYIGTQSGFIGQSRIDIDAAEELGIDYIDLGQFMTYYQ